MAPQQASVKNRAYSRKQDSQEEPDETAIVNKPVENENKKAPPPGESFMQFVDKGKNL